MAKLTYKRIVGNEDVADFERDMKDQFNMTPFSVSTDKMVKPLYTEYHFDMTMAPLPNHVDQLLGHYFLDEDEAMQNDAVTRLDKMQEAEDKLKEATVLIQEATEGTEYKERGRHFLINRINALIENPMEPTVRKIAKQIKDYYL